MKAQPPKPPSIPRQSGCPWRIQQLVVLLLLDLHGPVTAFAAALHVLPMQRVGLTLTSASTVAGWLARPPCRRPTSRYLYAPVLVIYFSSAGSRPAFILGSPYLCDGLPASGWQILYGPRKMVGGLRVTSGFAPPLLASGIRFGAPCPGKPFLIVSDE